MYLFPAEKGSTVTHQLRVAEIMHKVTANSKGRKTETKGPRSKACTDSREEEKKKKKKKKGREEKAQAHHSENAYFRVSHAKFISR